MKGAVLAAILAVVSAQGDGTGGGDGGGTGTRGGGGGGTGTGGGSAPACASTDAGCSAYSLITSGTCDGTAGCAAILDEDACRALHDQVDVVLCVATSPRAPRAPRAPRRGPRLPTLHSTAPRVRRAADRSRPGFLQRGGQWSL